jgi:hypothetical protein
VKIVVVVVDDDEDDEYENHVMMINQHQPHRTKNGQTLPVEYKPDD